MMKKWMIVLLGCIWGSWSLQAQPGESMYGETAKADVKMKYVYSLEEALSKAKKENKPVFFNCFADWALPCHGMNKHVFSDADFCEWMNRHFVNLWIDVTTPEGRPLAEKYNIRFQAHYLVLDSEGNIIHRIVGGYRLPEFKEKVALALSPKTSLAGMNRRYADGERGVKFLRNYASVLSTADEKELYAQVLEEYFAKVKRSDWAKQENWQLFRDRVKKPEGEMFDYLMEHAGDFVKNNGEQEVYDKIASFYLMPVYGMATGKEYNSGQLLDIYLTLQKVNLPESHMIYTLYHIAQYRGKKNYDKMMEVFEEKVPALEERVASGLDFSLQKDWENLPVKDQQRMAEYLGKRAEQLTGSQRESYLKKIKEMTDPEGIRFEDLSLAEALSKAKTEGKLVFIDCYTTWCGPCKMMSERVFPQKAIGDFFNSRFVNVKMDMEKGEGPEVQKRYGVNAFPTMMLLDGEGRIVYKMLGGSDARGFMKKVERGILPQACYYLLKERYEGGKRDAETMPEYFLTMIDAGELVRPQEEVRNYLNMLDEREKFGKPAWKLMDYLITGLDVPEFGYLCTHRKQFEEQVGQEEVYRKIESILFPAVIGYLQQSQTREDMEAVKKSMDLAELPENCTLRYLERIVGLYEGKDYSGLLDFYEQQVYELEDAYGRLNLDVLLNRLLDDAPVAVRQRAVDYVGKCLDQADPKAVNAYKRLLEALSEKEA